MVTTHSPHIIYDTSFDPIRYFRRRTALDGAPVCEVRDLSKLQTADSKFLRRFLKITNCHLFFADAVILVEGDAERILLPLMIDKDPSRMSQLASSHISLLEVGGSHAHRFKPLVSFLGLPTLIIADIDSIGPVEGKKKDAAVPASTPNARSANSTLKTWLPRKVEIKELLDTPVGEKIGNHEDGVDPAKVRVAYQGRRMIEWNNQHHEAAGRTFEEAMILDNLEWLRDCGEKIGFQLGENISAEQVEREVFEFVTRPPGGKTNLALTLFDLYEEKPWNTPYYIQEGLVWLNSELDREADL